MVAILAIVKVLSRAVKRDTRSFLSVGSNNLFLFAALMAYSSLASNMKPLAAIPFFLLMLLIILFPLSADPLSKIPSSRLALWPLSRKQMIQLRIASLVLSPVVWVGLLISIASRSLTLPILFVVAALVAHVLSALGSLLVRHVPTVHPLKPIPAIPGRLGGIIRYNIRQILSVLDFYAALVVSIGALFYRFFFLQPSPDAYPIIAMMIALALSTYTQCSFGLDSSSALNRYRLLPLAGWQILAAKDGAFLVLLGILSLPTGSGTLASLTFGLIVLAIGRYPSLVVRIPQHRWRFASGDLRFSIAQFITARSPLPRSECLPGSRPARSCCT